MPCGLVPGTDGIGWTPDGEHGAVGREVYAAGDVPNS